MSRIAFYITSHGFGHSTREIEVINHVPESIDVEIVTAVPQWLFNNSINRPFSYVALRHDPGVIQIDSLHQDLDQTYESWSNLLDEYPSLARGEAHRILRQGTTLIVGDISPFSVAVAQAADLPSVIVANFSWNWIAQAFLPEKPEFQTLISQFESYYRQCDLLLRTPLAGDLSVFPVIRDIPLIVRRSKYTKKEARICFGLNEEDRVVLVSFGGHDFNRIRAEHLQKYPDITFLTFNDRFKGLTNVRVLDPQKTYHPDALCTSDLVLSKLGYGIVTESIAHQVPLVYPPRQAFPEFDVLEQETPKYVEIIRLTEDNFFSGKWDFLYEFFSRHDQDRPGPKKASRLQLNGGETTARILSQMARGIGMETVSGT